MEGHLTVEKGGFPEMSEAWTPGWAPQSRVPEQGKAAHVVSSGEKEQGYNLPGREMEAAGDKAMFFFKGLEHRMCVYSHSPWASAAEGGW